jgi:hypothetical protein
MLANLLGKRYGAFRPPKSQVSRPRHALQKARSKAASARITEPCGVASLLEPQRHCGPSGPWNAESLVGTLCGPLAPPGPRGQSPEPPSFLRPPAVLGAVPPALAPRPWSVRRVRVRGNTPTGYGYGSQRGSLVPVQAPAPGPYRREAPGDPRASYRP